MQKTIITGNLGADPVKSFENGGKVATMQVLPKEVTRHRVGMPEYRRCVKSNGLCGVVEQYLKKGNKVMIVGKHKRI